MARSNSLPPRGRPAASRKREADKFEPLPRFLIVCEGSKTEPNYFRQFRVPREVLTVEGTGYNTLSLVTYALDLREKAKPPYDQVWCVFDRDSFPLDDFNAAIVRAGHEGLGVAYSNEAFELWFLLHYDFHTSGLHRSQYEAKLTARLNRPYKKNDPLVYSTLEPLQEQAIRNARALLLRGTGNPGKDNPSTTVHLLVEQLREAERRPWQR